MDYTAYSNMFGNSGSWFSALKNQNDIITPASAAPSVVNAASPLDARALGIGIFTPKSSALGNGDTGRSGSPVTTLPDGSTVNATGNRGVDLLDRLFGTSPLAPERESPDGDVVAPGTGNVQGLGGGVFEAIGSFVPRLAIIVLGIVFVAVGLAMFKDNPISVVVGAVR